jgi:Ulp1 family protease
MRAIDTSDLLKVQQEFNTIGTDENTIVGSFQVTKNSFQMLLPSEWLGNQALHFAYKLLQLRDSKLCQQNLLRKPSHFFDPTFLGYIHGNQGALHWRSRGVDLLQLFEHDNLFFTGNPSASHWILIVVDFPKKRIQVYDSVNQSNANFLHIVFLYLQDVHLHHLGCDMVN